MKKDSCPGNIVTADEYEVFNTSDTSVNFTLNHTIPGNIKTGSYRYTVHAYDGVRNEANPVSILVEIE